MDVGVRNRMLVLGTVVMLLVGVTLTVSQAYYTTVAGIIMVILSVIVLMVDVTVFLLDASDQAL